MNRGIGIAILCAGLIVWNVCPVYHNTMSTVGKMSNIKKEGAVMQARQFLVALLVALFVWAISGCGNGSRVVNDEDFNAVDLRQTDQSIIDAYLKELELTPGRLEIPATKEAVKYWTLSQLAYASRATANPRVSEYFRSRCIRWLSVPKIYGKPISFVLTKLGPPNEIDTEDDKGKGYIYTDPPSEYPEQLTYLAIFWTDPSGKIVAITMSP